MVLAGAALQRTFAWRLPPARGARLPATASGVRLTRTLAALRRTGVTRTTSPVVINEVMTRNPGDLLDDRLTASDWIELFNRSDRPVDLKGWTLSDSSIEARRWTFPSAVVDAHSFQLVWCSGRDESVDPLSREIMLVPRGHEPWTMEYDSGVPGGIVTRFQGDAESSNLLTVALVVGHAGQYALSLFARAEEEGESALRVSVDGCEPFVVSCAASLDYRSVPISRPNAADAAWTFAEGMHTVGIGGSRGKVRVARVDARDTARAGAPPLALHSSFRLSAFGEPVILLDPAGNVADYVTPPAMPLGRTLQRVPDGGEAFRVAEPSPEGRVLRDGPDFAGYPTVSPGPLTVIPPRLPGTEEVRYTLDGRTPEAGDAPFREPLVVSNYTVLRARGFASGRPVTAVSTRQFWIGPRPGDLTLCVAAEPANLANTDMGIFNRRKRKRTDWERPCRALLLDASRTYFDGAAGLRSHAWRNTAPEKNSLHLNFRGSFGEDALRENPFVPGSAVRPRALIADASGAGWADEIGYAVTRAAGGAAPYGRPVVLYANGRPYSLGVLFENVDREFLLNRWGHDQFDLIKMKPRRLKLGSDAALDAYREFIGKDRAGAPLSREAVERHVDVDNLTSWILPLILCDASDGGRWINREAFQGYVCSDRRKDRKPIGFIAWDMDQSFHTFDYDTLQGLCTRGVFTIHAGTFRALLRDDPAFRAFFAGRMQDALNHVFRTDLWTPRVQGYADFYRRNAAHYAFAAAGRPPVGTEAEDRVRDWEARFDDAKLFLRERPAFMWRYTTAWLKLPEPFAVRVTSEGARSLRIDGHEEPLPYEGKYLPGSRLVLERSAADRSGPGAFVVNGSRLDARRLDRQVEGDLVVEALFPEAPADTEDARGQ
jgi:hypothetical protein